MTDTGNANCRELLDVLIGQGLDTVVLSPGSRNAPLLIGVAARKELRKFIITDERTAGFAALGIGLASQKPVALICTSGTALYNYAPAVAEAFYQKIPLIVITADRPSQWIEQDDSQTLRQFGALKKIVKRSYDIPEETGINAVCANPQYKTEREWFVNRIANEAIICATHGTPGPVHINMQFGNPLNNTIPCSDAHPRCVRTVGSEATLPPHQSKEIAEMLIRKKVMVVAGFMKADHNLNRALAAFSAFPNATVLCETISNIHLDGHVYMIDSLLTSLTEEQLDRMRPDIVITTGGAIVSRMLKDYIRKSEGTQHWTLADTDVSIDCFQRLSMHVDIAPAKFFRSVNGMMRHLMNKGYGIEHGDYGLIWQQERERLYQRDCRRLKSVGWSELKALSEVFRRIPADYNLFLSNGTCVRYAQLLTDKLPHACFSNRGVSGIDGTNATAWGVSVAYKGTTLLLTGDMSFAYCPEIMNLRKSGGDLRIIVVNNNGGGIFRFIKTTRDLEMREEYFCCDPEMPIKGLTEAFGWKYVHASDMNSLKDGLDILFSTPATLLEISVDPEKSAETLIKWMENK